LDNNYSQDGASGIYIFPAKLACQSFRITLAHPPREAVGNNFLVKASEIPSPYFHEAWNHHHISTYLGQEHLIGSQYDKM
jgi:hypothetical protein